MKNKFFILGFLTLSVTSLCSAYQYHAEIELKDGTIHTYDGSTHGAQMEDHFGHDPSTIVREDIEVTPWS